MADTQQQAVSFAPEDASGLLDNARMKITDANIDYFTSTKGDKFVNLNVAFEGGGQKITEHYLLGGANDWAPNDKKTGAISLTGGKVWNKSDVFRSATSLADAGIRVVNDWSVIVGADVHINRVTQEGSTYTDKNGKVRERTTLLITKVYELPKAGGAKTTAAAKPAAKAAPAAAGEGVSDDYVTQVLLDALGSGAPVAKEALPKSAFVYVTRDKSIDAASKASTRTAVQARLQDEAFLGSLVEQGLIAYDGKTVGIAA